MGSFFEVTRVLLVVFTFLGTIYAVRSFRDALLDARVVRAQENSDPVMVAICEGLRDDQLQLTLTQATLLLAALISQLGPVPTQTRAWAVVGVFICLLVTSAILALRSYKQVQRRRMIGALIARQRRTAVVH